MQAKNYHLQFARLLNRKKTDLLIIHHTGADIDASAEQIHSWHIAQGWAGCGYHWIIRKDGTLERGRPEWAQGSHAEGFNSQSIGIHLSGDFSSTLPTNAQITTLTELIRDIAADYNIPIDRDHILGHCDLNDTDCPGIFLYDKLPDIIDAASRPAYEGTPIADIFDLAARYESNNNPAAVSDKFFGIFQFSLSTVKEFATWLQNYYDPDLAKYGTFLLEAPNLKDAWLHLANTDPGNFLGLQQAFARAFFYDNAAHLLSHECFHVEEHSLPLRAVVFSRALQHGSFGCSELFKRACPYPNLSYVDDAKFDRKLIAAVYNYLLDNPNFTTQNSKLHPALAHRFTRELADALA